MVTREGHAFSSTSKSQYMLRPAAMGATVSYNWLRATVRLMLVEGELRTRSARDIVDHEQKTRETTAVSNQPTASIISWMQSTHHLLQIKDERFLLGQEVRCFFL
jgi:hypothetical protein